MRHQFVKVSNYKRFRAGITQIEARGAMEASMLLVTGPAGRGKTSTVDQWASEANAIFLRAPVNWSPHKLELDLADVLGIDTNQRSRDLFAKIIREFARQQTPIVIDEVQNALANGAACLEHIRDISDLAEMPVVLIGMEDIKTKLARHMQIASRIGAVVEFQPITQDDCTLICRDLAEVRIAPEVVAEVHAQCDGRMRLALNALAAIEQLAKRNGKTEVVAADIAGMRLCEDWQRNIKRGARP